MELVRWEDHPVLRRPLFVIAFEGWNDAGDAATLAVDYFAEDWRARRCATIDPEEFYDFTVTRPRVRPTSDGGRLLEWPDVELLAAEVPGADHDILLLRGVEPQMRWRTFCQAVVSIVDTRCGPSWWSCSAPCSQTSLIPARCESSGSSSDPDLARRAGFATSTYEGPTGIVGVLVDALAPGQPARGFPVGRGPALRPSGAFARRRPWRWWNGPRTCSVPRSTRPRCGRRRSEYERQVSERVADDEDAAAYVAQLEDAEDLESSSPEPAATGWTSQDGVPSGSSGLRRAAAAGQRRQAGRRGRALLPRPPPAGLSRRYPVARLVAAAVWRARPDLIVALDDRFGEPVDAYVNGSQVWLREDGPGRDRAGVAVAPGRPLPAADEHRDLRGLRGHGPGPGNGGTAPAPLTELWDGLEAFAAYGEELEPRPLAVAASRGPRDRTRRLRAWSTTSTIAAEWERTSGSVSIVADLFRQLKAAAPASRTGRSRHSGLEPVVQIDLAQDPAEASQAVDDGRRNQPGRAGIWAPGRGLGGSGSGRTRPIPGSTPPGSPRSSGGWP